MHQTTSNISPKSNKQLDQVVAIDDSDTKFHHKKIESTKFENKSHDLSPNKSSLYSKNFISSENQGFDLDNSAISGVDIENRNHELLHETNRNSNKDSSSIQYNQQIEIIINTRPPDEIQ